MSWNEIEFSQMNKCCDAWTNVMLAIEITCRNDEYVCEHET